MSIFQKWLKNEDGWDSGSKHPETHPVVFRNCWSQDLVRRVLSGRCHECGYVVSDDAKAVKELLYKCQDLDCACARIGMARTHRVCDACYNIFHSLYINYGMRNRNYFRDFDEKDTEGRKRMGLK